MNTIQLFYWMVQFSDGYIFYNFDQDGKERMFRDFAPSKCYKEIDGKMSLDLTENVFADLEQQHGRAIKCGWIPFNVEQKQFYENVNPTISIELLKEPQPFIVEIPETFHAYLRKEIEIKYGMDGPKKVIAVMPDGMQIEEPEIVCQSDIHFGYVPRVDKSIQGLVYSIHINLKDNIPSSYGMSSLDVSN